MAEIRTDQIFEDIVETIHEPLLILDQGLRVVLASRSFYEFFKVTPEETVGQLIYDMGNKQWNIPKLRELLETILPEKTSFDNYEVEHDFATIGKHTMLLNARQIEQAMGKERIILLAIEDITERKKIEAGLEKTRKELAVIKKSADDAHEFADSVINTVREPLISLDQDLRVVTVSRSFYDFFKVKPEETVGQLIYDLGNKQWDIPKLRELLETILPEKTSFDNYEVEHDFATIGKHTMLLNARQIEQAMGKERIILLAIEDITERMKAETILKNSEEQYRRLFETADDGILLLEKSKLKIRHANPAIKAMLGYSDKELIGNDIKNIGIPDTIGTFQEILQTLNKDGIAHFEDVVVQNKAGEAIYTDIYMADRALLVQCNVRDITGRKKAENEIIEREEKYRRLFESIRDAILVADVDRSIIDFNSAFGDLFGYSINEIRGKKTSCVYENEEQFHKLGKALKEQNGKAHFLKTVNYKKKNGEIFPGETGIYYLKNQNNEVTGLIGLIRDITAKRKSEADKQMIENQLHQAQKMESVGRLAGGVAHDYNNISSIIIGYTELALESIEQSNPLYDDLMEILTAAKRSTNITRQLLAFARQQTVAPKVIDLNDTIGNSTFGD